MPDSPTLYKLEKLRGLYMNNEEFVFKTIEVFVVQINSDVELMNQKLMERDWEALKKIAHKMKPNIDLLEMESITGDIRYIEKNAARENAGNTTECVQKVSSIIRAARLELKEYLRQNKGSN